MGRLIESARKILPITVAVSSFAGNGLPHEAFASSVQSTTPQKLNTQITPGNFGQIKDINNLADTLRPNILDLIRYLPNANCSTITVGHYPGADSTLSQIATDLHTNVKTLQKEDNIANPKLIEQGQKISHCTEGKDPTPMPTGTPTVSQNYGQSSGDDFGTSVIKVLLAAGGILGVGFWAKNKVKKFF